MAERGTRARTRRAACRVHSFVPRDGGPVVDHETVRELEKLLVAQEIDRLQRSGPQDSKAVRQFCWTIGKHMRTKARALLGHVE